jgi:hypothetical protein
LSRLPSSRGSSAAAAPSSRSAAAARPRGVLVQSPKSDIYVALLGIALGALIIACILMTIVMGRYGFSTKVGDATVPSQATAIA